MGQYVVNLLLAVMIFAFGVVIGIFWTESHFQGRLYEVLGFELGADLDEELAKPGYWKWRPPHSELLYSKIHERLELWKYRRTLSGLRKAVERDNRPKVG